MGRAVFIFIISNLWVGSGIVSDAVLFKGAPRLRSAPVVAVLVHALVVDALVPMTAVGRAGSLPVLSRLLGEADAEEGVTALPRGAGLPHLSDRRFM